jgi:hypothetical protein
MARKGEGDKAHPLPRLTPTQPSPDGTGLLATVSRQGPAMRFGARATVAVRCRSRSVGTVDHTRRGAFEACLTR